MGITLGPGQFQDVTSASAAGDVTIYGGGLQFIESGAYAWYTTINNGGTQWIKLGGHAFSTTINAGGVQDDSGIAYGTSIKGWAGDYAFQIVEKSGYANDTVIYQFGVQDVDGWVDNTTIFGGGQQVIENGGGAAHTAVYAAGTQFVELGKSWWTTVYEGGKQMVYAGGDAMYTTVNGNNYLQTGKMIVEVGGTSDTATINVYGVQDVYGIAKNTTVNGGKQDIGYNATATNTLVEGGGMQIVEAGGDAVNTIISVNGNLRVLAGGTVDGVYFGATNALLDLDHASSVNGPIHGFGDLDQIDLRDIHYGAGTTLAFSAGVLSVKDGYGDSAKLAFLGQYAAAGFGLTSDGHGGTFINYSTAAAAGSGSQLGGLIAIPLHI